MKKILDWLIKILGKLKVKLDKENYFYVTYITSKGGVGRVLIYQNYGDFNYKLFQEWMQDNYKNVHYFPIHVKEITKDIYEEDWEDTEEVVNETYYN